MTTARPMELNQYQCMYAVFVASMRRAQGHVISGEKGTTQGYTREHQNWDDECEGAAAEMAVAKWLDLFWCGRIANLKKPDVGPWQVRQTKYTSGHLLLNKRDKGDEYFFLVTGRMPKFMIYGPMLCSEGQLEKYWDKPKREGGECYMVPREIVQAAKPPVWFKEPE